MCKPRLLVRWCGGCNPRFDRAAALRVLSRYLGDPEIVYTPDKSCAAALILCGCLSACATVKDIPLPPSRLVYLSDPAGLGEAAGRLAALLSPAAAPLFSAAVGNETAPAP